MSNSAEIKDLLYRIDLTLAAHKNAMTAEGGDVPYRPYDLLSECRDQLAELVQPKAQQN